MNLNKFILYSMSIICFNVYPINIFHQNIGDITEEYKELEKDLFVEEYHAEVSEPEGELSCIKVVSPGPRKGQVECVFTQIKNNKISQIKVHPVYHTALQTKYDLQQQKEAEKKKAKAISPGGPSEK